MDNEPAHPRFGANGVSDALKTVRHSSHRIMTVHRFSFPPFRKRGERMGHLAKSEQRPLCRPQPLQHVFPEATAQR